MPAIKEIDSDQVGTAFTFTAIDADTKLIVAWHLGTRSEDHALTFLRKLRDAVDQDTAFQLSTDAFPGYNQTVPAILGHQAHYGQIKKIYGVPNPAEVRYSAAECIGCKKRKVIGNPIRKPETMRAWRMSMRRFTRLTNGFSKKWDNLNYMLAIYFAYYNFCRSHKTLNDATPAMAANLKSTIWSLKDLLSAAKDVHAPV